MTIRSEKSLSGKEVLDLAVWAGLATGFVEVVLLGLKRFYLGQFMRFGMDTVWMAPVADVTLFLIAAVFLFALGNRLPRLLSLRIAVLVFGFMGFLSVLFMYYPLHVYAKILLAAGLAVQASRAADRWQSGFKRLVRGTTVGMAALVIFVALGTNLWTWASQRQAVALLPPSPAGAPNVLLIVLDTVRAHNLSLYGYGRETTPNLDRLAQSSVAFDNAISSSPWTLPSHGTMFTGRWPHELSADWEESLDNRYPTLAEILSKNGYVTAGFVANTHYCGSEFGLARGFGHYEDYAASLGEMLVSSSMARAILNNRSIRRLTGYYDNIPRKDAEALTDDFLTWTAGQGTRPFFAFLNYFDAHEAYLPPAPFNEKFGPDLPRGNEVLTQDLRRSYREDWFKRPPQEIQTEIDMYDGAIAYMDSQLGRLFDELQNRGLLSNTMVIITSDHGEQFGENGLFLHGNSLYEPLLHVPLVISFPDGAPAGRRVTDRVSLRDLPATVTDLIGLEEIPFPGRSLARYWNGSKPPLRSTEPVLSEVRRADWGQDWYPAAIGDMQSLMDDRYHYLRNADGREQLYEIASDPGEQHDISSTADPQILATFRHALASVLAGGLRD